MPSNDQPVQRPRQRRAADAALSAGAHPLTDAPKDSPYERIKNAILDGQLTPGQALAEASLAKWCGVSRTPIHEALSRLEHDGLLHRDLRGFVVRARSSGEILDMYETRTLLEAAAARLAAQRRTDHDVLILQWNHEHCQTILESDVEGMVRANRKFHHALWRASHNDSLIDLLERIDLHLGPHPATTLSSPGRWAESLSEHQRLLDAIEQKDGDSAAEIAEQHGGTSRAIRLQRFAEEMTTRSQ